jgi:hypothetical protein
MLTGEGTSHNPVPNHEIFVNGVREEWDQNQVLASDIMKTAGGPVDNAILEALDRPNGKSVQDFNPGDNVDLTVKDRKFFRITPGGGGFS